MNVNNIEKLVAWIVGLALVIVGALSTAQSYLPKSMAGILAVAGVLLMAIERWLTNNGNSNSPPSSPSK